MIYANVRITFATTQFEPNYLGRAYIVELKKSNYTWNPNKEN